jgi:hypothetical protein
MFPKGSQDLKIVLRGGGCVEITCYIGGGDLHEVFALVSNIGMRW